MKHEWYAAGHPPLPSFELASFEAQMPVHWQSLPRKGSVCAARRAAAGRRPAACPADRIAHAGGVPADAIKGSYREANFPAAAAGGLDPCSDLPRAKDAIVAGVVALESYVRTLGDYSAAAADQQCSVARTGALRLFGLSSRVAKRASASSIARCAVTRPAGRRWRRGRWCWHNSAPLRPRDTSRQRRLPVGRRFMAQLLELEQATTARPFGDSAAMRAAAQPLVDSLSKLAADVSASRFDAAAAANALRYLTEPANYETNDYATARQAAGPFERSRRTWKWPIPTDCFRAAPMTGSR